MAARRNNNRFTIRKNGRGMTLVELIVVLVILSILAAAGVGTAVGYVKRSAFNQNESNAEAIYHAVQTGLQQMEKASSISDWVKDKLLADGHHLEYDSSNASSNITLEKIYDLSNFTTFNKDTAIPNSSVHMRYYATFNPSNSTSDESKLLKNLIAPFFSDEVIFNGTITVEFDVEKGVDAYKTLHYSAKCLSVFFNSRSTTAWNGVPSRDEKTREKDTLIGYYDGYKGTSVDTVYLPQYQEGIKVKKLAVDYSTVQVTVTPTPTDGSEPQTKDELHTWVSWAATLDTNNLLGTKKNVYYRIALYEDSSVKKVLIFNEDFLLQGDVIGNTNNSYKYKSQASHQSTCLRAP